VNTLQNLLHVNEANEGEREKDQTKPAPQNQIIATVYTLNYEITAVQWKLSK